VHMMGGFGIKQSETIHFRTDPTFMRLLFVMYCSPLRLVLTTYIINELNMRAQPALTADHASEQDVRYRLEQAFLSKSGAQEYHVPRITGLYIELFSGEVYGSHGVEMDDLSTARGPELGARGCRSMLGEDNLYCCYDTEQRDAYAVGPFKYRRMEVKEAKFLLTMEEAFFLQATSTSPLAEPVHYSNDCRTSVRFQVGCPSWEKYFANGPHIYTRQDIKTRVL
jgi:hypothetical protein